MDRRTPRARVVRGPWPDVPAEPDEREPPARPREDFGWSPLVFTAAATAWRVVAGLQRGEGASPTVLLLSLLSVACFALVWSDLADAWRSR